MTEENTDRETEAGARERLLGAALTLFNEKGYAAASVREIVEAAGVTKPVLYYYFGNKEGLYLELMQGAYDTFESMAANFASIDGSAQEKIVYFCRDIFNASLQRLPLVRLINSIYFGPPQGAPHFDFDAYYIRMMQVIQNMVAAGMARGELRRNSVDDVSRAVIAILTSGVNEQLAKREEKLDLEGMVRTLRLLMEGVAAKG